MSYFQQKLNNDFKKKANEQTRQNRNRLIDTENKVIARKKRGKNLGKICEEDQKVQISSYKITIIEI